MGRVRLALNAAAFDVGIWSPDNREFVATLTLVVALGTALAAACMTSLITAWRTGAIELTAHELGTQLRERIARIGPGGVRTVQQPAAPLADPAPPPTISHYLLGVNLYNQLSLKGAEREFELSLCTELAEAVALEYQGQVVSLPGLGALIDFDDTEAPDRAFEIVCASFALARLLRDEAPFGHYRLGLHRVSQAGDAPLPLDHPGVKDVALLSALARDGSVAMSEPMVAAIAEQDRLQTRPMNNVLLEELITSGPACALMTDLDSDEKTRVLQLVESLKTQRDAIASESTF